MTEFKYCVYCEEEPAICFESEAEAMKFAREDTSMYNSVRVEKSEIDEDGDVLNTEVLWTASGNNVPEKEIVPENEFETEFPESDIANIDTSDDVDYDELARQYAEDPADWIDDNKLIKEAVDVLEENEDEVECKVCFELGPKAEMKKLDIGYVCPKCAQELQSHQGTNLDLLDNDPFSLDYEDPRDFDEPEEEEVKEEPVNGTEMRKHEKAIEEELKVIIDFSEYKPWSGAVDTYELIKDADKLDELEAYLEECYPEGVTAGTINDILWFDSEEILKYLGLGDVEEDEEEVDESLNEEETFKQGFDSYNAYGEKVEENLEEKVDLPAFDSDVKVGDKIRIIHLEGEDNSYDGKEGEVTNIDSIGQLHGTWGGLAVIPGVDQFEAVIEEHVNDRPADIESDQVLQGADNAVVDCDVAKVIAHSEDEKPLDCKMEKPALEEPLAGEEVKPDLVEAKKDDELPVDPEAAKLEVHTMLNDLVADEIEAINGYEEAKKEILDTPIAHKDNILDTIDHVEDEEKEHVDELISATTEIPFDKEEAPAPVVEEPVVKEEPLDQEFPEVDENLEEEVSEDKFAEVEAYLKNADRGSIDFEWETDEDICNGSILWNEKKERFEAGLSIYHASEDNNAEYPEMHTDEEDASAKTIKELYKLLVDDYGEEFKNAFEDAINHKELTEEKAKPEGNKVLSYNKALAIANSEGKPVIYGYTNTSYNGKYFEVDPIVCNSVSDETKKFKQQYKSAGTVYVAYPGKSFIESLREAANVDYVEYMHSYCNALEPHMDELKKIEDVEELKKAILDIVNKDPDVNTTEKKNKFVWLIKNKKWGSTKSIMKYLEKAMNKAKGIEVKVDDNGELIKEDIEEADPKETQFVFTPEEQAEYNCDEDGNCEDGYDQLCHCGWCGEVFPTSEMRHEVDFGWICSRCEDELKSHGGPLTFIEEAVEKKDPKDATKEA